MSNLNSSVTDPFTFFQQQVFLLAKECGFPADFASEALAILKGAFGENWILQMVSIKDQSSPVPHRGHPIADALVVAGESQISDLFELAIYLKELASVPGLQEVVHSLRAPLQYETSLVQLAFAYRLKKLGVENIILEPNSANNRKADIGFTFLEKSYLVECYVPIATNPDNYYEMSWAVKNIFDKRKNKQYLAILIYLKRRVSSLDRKRIQGVIKNAIRDMNTEEKVIEDEAAKIIIRQETAESITRYQPRRSPSGTTYYENADIAWGQSWISEEDLQKARLGKDKREVINWILVWKSPEESDEEKSAGERLKLLTDKISQKLVQARSENGSDRIVIVSIPEAKERSHDIAYSIKDIGSKLSTRHKNLASALLVSRVWSDNSRHAYVGYLLSNTGDPKVNAFLFELANNKNFLDVIKGWQ